MKTWLASISNPNVLLVFQHIVIAIYAEEMALRSSPIIEIKEEYYLQSYILTI